jgi:hypothetical protein
MLAAAAARMSITPPCHRKPLDSDGKTTHEQGAFKTIPEKLVEPPIKND